jgi:plastocyanin
MKAKLMKKFTYFLIIVIILAAGYYFYAQKNKQAVAPTVENNNSSDQTGEVQQESGAPEEQKPEETKVELNAGANVGASQGTYSDGSEAEEMAPDVLVVQVEYDGSKYTPSSVDVKVGDIVIFKNTSSGQMWPASAPHPTHTNYPAFDANTPIQAGGKWQFKFGQEGAWRYHDHLNASVGGVVNVSAK